MPTAKKTVKKPVKKTTKKETPAHDYSVNSRLVESMLALAKSNVVEAWGMEALLYDMRRDYKKARAALGNIVLHGAVETNLGNFDVNVLSVCTHRAGRYNDGYVAFKFHIAYRYEGSLEVKTEIVVLNIRNVDEALSNFCWHAGEVVADWYSDKFRELYGEIEDF